MIRETVFSGTHPSTAQKKHKNQPLFMLVAPQNVHSPQQVPDRFLNSEIKDKKRRIHSAMVSALDEFVGNVTGSFKNHGMLDDTNEFLRS